MQAKVIDFPTHDVLEKRKIDRLTELKEQYLRLQDLEDVIYEEAMEITGERHINGHTLNYLANDPGKTAEDLLSDIVRNPSEFWDLDSDPNEPEPWPEIF